MDEEDLDLLRTRVSLIVDALATQVCRQESEAVKFDKRTINACTELLIHYTNLRSFSHHAKRQTINVEDVLLCARKSDSLLSSLETFVKANGGSLPKKPAAKAKGRSKAAVSFKPKSKGKSGDSGAMQPKKKKTAARAGALVISEESSSSSSEEELHVDLAKENSDSNKESSDVEQILLDM